MMYCVGVRGPDDVIATRDYPEAVALSNLLNAGFAAIVRKGFTENDPLVWASPGLWSMSEERHAASLADPGDDYREAAAAARLLIELQRGARGNGRYRWYWAISDDAESWHGAFSTREEAEDDARGELETEPPDAWPDEVPCFFVAEADKSVVGPLSGDEWLEDAVIERLAETNEECWGEDGWDDAWTAEARLALRRMLEGAVATWLAQFPAKTWSLNDWRVCDRVELQLKVRPVKYDGVVD